MSITCLLDGRYQLIRCLGSSSRGKTYLASDTSLANCPKCVIKQLHLGEHSPRTSKFISLLLKKKADVLRQMSCHEQLPTLLTYFEEANSVFLVEEFIPGPSLSDIIIQGQPLPEAAVISIMEELLQALVAIHRWGVIHHNIKPSNIIQHQPDRRLVLIGFDGFQKIIANDSGSSHTNVCPGDRLYVPPDEHLGQRFSSDIYAVGVIAIQGLTGLSAQRLEPVLAKAKASPRLGTAVWQDDATVSSGLRAIIERMTYPDMEYRYQTAAEVLDDLQWLSHSPSCQGQQPSALGLDSLGSVGLDGQRQTPLLTWRNHVRRWGVGVAIAVCLMGLIVNRIPQLLLSYYLVHRASETNQQGQHRETVALATRALQHADQNWTAYLRRGIAYYRLGDSEAAQHDLTQAIRLNQRSGLAFYYRGSVQELLGDRQGALTDYTRTLELGTYLTETYLKRGDVRASLGDNQGAILDYTQVLQGQPDSEAAYARRCLAYSNKGDLQKGLQDCSRAINLKPGFVTAYQNRSLVRQRLGDSDGAMADLTIALRLDPQNADIYYRRGKIRLQINDTAGALEDFSQALEIAPSHNLARQKQDLIKQQMGNTPNGVRNLDQTAALCLELGPVGCPSAEPAELTPSPPSSPPGPI